MGEIESPSHGGHGQSGGHVPTREQARNGKIVFFGGMMVDLMHEGVKHEVEEGLKDAAGHHTFRGTAASAGIGTAIGAVFDFAKAVAEGHSVKSAAVEAGEKSPGNFLTAVAMGPFGIPYNIANEFVPDAYQPLGSAWFDALKLPSFLGNEAGYQVYRIRQSLADSAPSIVLQQIRARQNAAMAEEVWQSGYGGPMNECVPEGPPPPPLVPIIPW